MTPLLTMAERQVLQRVEPSATPEALDEYERFLQLKVAAKDVDALILSPSAEIDAIWHAHVLDTAAYANVCARLGLFLHHNPSLATNDAAQEERYLRTYLRLPAESRRLKHIWPLPESLESLVIETVRAAVADASTQGAARVPKRARDTQTLVIKTLTGMHATLTVHESDTIWHVMKLFEEQSGIATSMQVLLIGDKRYTACDTATQTETLESLGVGNHATLMCILKLRGC